MSADWSLWADIPHTELWKAVALSMDIEPTKLPGYDRSCVRDPFSNYPFHQCPEEFRRRLEIARTHLGRKLMPISFCQPDWKSEVDLQELSSWATELNSPWTFPEKFPSHESAVVKSDEDTQLGEENERQLLKRQALIDQLRPRWPTIEHDLREASRNKLDSAKSHGKWDFEKATQWAMSLGKLKSASDTRSEKMTSLPWP